MNDNIIVATIAGLCGVLSAYYANRYNIHRKAKKPQGIQFALDGYERLLKDQQHELSRKSDLIDTLEQEVDEMRRIITTIRVELEDTKEQNRELKVQLTRFKADYNTTQ